MNAKPYRVSSDRFEQVMSNEFLYAGGAVCRATCETKYSDASCWAQHPANKDKRNACKAKLAPCKAGCEEKKESGGGGGIFGGSDTRKKKRDERKAKRAERKTKRKANRAERMAQLGALLSRLNFLRGKGGLNEEEQEEFLELQEEVNEVQQEEKAETTLPPDTAKQ